MRVAWKISHMAAFAAMAATAVLTVDRVVQPPMTEALLASVGLGLLVGLPGYLHRRALPGTILLLPLGLYVLLRVVLPLPLDVETRADQLAFYTDELRLGLRAYADDIFPLTLDSAAGFELLLAVGAFLFAAVASFLGLGMRTTVAGIAALVVLLGFTATVDSAPSAGPTLLFLAFATLTLVTSEGARRHGRRLRDGLEGIGVGAAAIGMAVLLLAVFPGLTRPGLADWKTWDPFNSGRPTVFVFNWKQNYPRLLDPGNAVPIMKVTSRVPSYWRATTLEYFTGDTWLNSAPYPVRLPDGPGPRRIPPIEPEPPGGPMVQKFELRGTSTNYVFTGGSPRSLTLDVSSAVNQSDSGALRTATSLHSPIDYEVTAVVPRVQPELLVGTPRDYPEDVRSLYLDLPMPDAATYQQAREAEARGEETMPWNAWIERPRAVEFEGIYALNEAIVGDAEDPYEATLKIERYLRAHYAYSLEVPPSTYASPIAAFLFDTKMGYCQHFAGAMALLLRLNGIPSRVAVGFTTGEQIGTWTYLVSSNNAHAWVEVYFAGIGWLPFDATPGRSLPLAGPSSASPGFVDPFAGRGAQGEGGGPATPPDATGRIPEGAGADAGAGTKPWRIPWGIAAPALFAVMLVAWPFTRRRVRERRVRTGRSGDRLRASITLLREDLGVAGVPVRASSTLDQVARLADDTLRLDLAPLVGRAQQVAFGGSYASAEDVARAERMRRGVMRLAWKRRRLACLAAWYGVAPLLDSWRARSANDATGVAQSRKGPTWRLRP